jgi:leader peptidase (prepilin peptidase)/N-methyltransferase
MDVVLVVGCAVAGAASGPFLDELGARIPPSRAEPVETTLEQDEIPQALALADAPEADIGAPEPAAGARFAGTAPSPPVPPSPPRPAERAGAAVLTAALFGGAAARLGAEPELAAFCVLLAGLVAISVADVRVGLVPRKIVYPTLVLVAGGLVGASLADGRTSALVTALVGGAGAFVVFFVIWWISPRSMGFGDVRLAGVIGFALGWLGYRELYLGFVFAFVAGSLFGAVKMVVQGTGRKTSLPFGPSLAFGAAVGVLWGQYLAGLWVEHVH